MRPRDDMFENGTFIALDTIDAALFTGDEFCRSWEHSSDKIEEFRRIMGRWERRLQEHERYMVKPLPQEKVSAMKVAHIQRGLEYDGTIILEVDNESFKKEYGYHTEEEKYLVFYYDNSEPETFASLEDVTEFIDDCNFED